MMPGRWWQKLGLGFAVGSTLAWPALAGEGEQWDHGHMQSRHRSLLEASAGRRGVEGQTLYGQLEKGGVREVPREVPERLEHVSQRAWEGRSGGPSLDTTLFPNHTSERAGSIPRVQTDGHGRSRNHSGRSQKSR